MAAVGKARVIFIYDAPGCDRGPAKTFNPQTTDGKECKSLVNSARQQFEMGASADP